ncbi:RsiV family protein [Nitratifractor salsuginis]|uniref:DUF3298 domain-containing protein n=1 Tax=Nitratifractor salsuginis (strain DSM 16511 / JCM 12458 / E9I37-1) TaxID=749222 RepID=E6X1U4_NITSE|nr:RsiV family protein [Nitratifractor salsuginis]ADV45952.1 hypothetical protein Nitsa_0685 [Nitratifractor salsuginis DSM 16511]
MIKSLLIPLISLLLFGGLLQAMDGDLPQSSYRLKSRTLKQSTCVQGKKAKLCYTKKIDLIDSAILKPSLRRIVEGFNAYYLSGYNEDKPRELLADVDPDDLIGAPEWIQQTSLEFYDYVAGIVTLEAYLYGYTGGAHPNSSVELRLFREKDGKELKLADLIGPGREKAFAKVAEKYFRIKAGLLPDEPLEDYGWIAEGFVIPENLAVTEKGLLALYSPYEARAYVYGYSVWTIPYYALRPLTAPNAALIPLTRPIHLQPPKVHRKITLGENDADELILDLEQKGKQVEVKATFTPSRDYRQLRLTFGFPQPLAPSKYPIHVLERSGFEKVRFIPKGTPIHTPKKRKKIAAPYPILQAESSSSSSYEPLELHFSFEPAVENEYYCLNYHLIGQKEGKIRELGGDDPMGQDPLGFELYRICIDLPKL